jgi:hypothetical protein
VYNQFLDVDPNDPNHVFVGLEEVYKTEDGGVHWTSIGPYWNFDFRCWSSEPSPQLLSDDDASRSAFDRVRQRARLRRQRRRPVPWSAARRDERERQRDRPGDLNANIRTLQYYSVAVGMVPGVVAVSGGLQDNGGSTWSRLGGNLPYTSALDVHLGPDNRIHAATHGRGIGRSQSRKRPRCLVYLVIAFPRRFMAAGAG